ncbi:MAG: phage major capsid protein [Huintestinicola sp.]
MATITTSGTLFKPELVTSMFNKVKGHSSLAKLCGASPMPFAGTDTFVFTMDGEASIVGEGGNKPAGEADFSTVTIKPIKFVYQHRLTDEFVNLSEEKQLPYLEAFSDGFAKKMARALDIAAIHGVNPYDGAPSDTIGNNCFDKAVTASITYDSSAPDDNIDAAVAPIQAADGIVTGIAMAPVFGSNLGAMKTKNSNLPMYPEFRFGANPATFGGMASDINNTVSFGSSKDRAIVGDFANAFKWGYAENIPLEIIEYGDPDGQGDLKRTNQIVLRAEAYIGWGILDKNSFALITAAE